MARGNGQVNVSNGADNMAFKRFVGLTVEDLRNDGVVQDSFSLTGDEQVTVTSDGEPAQVVGDDYVLHAGDQVVFSRQTGEKGSV